MVLQTVAHIQSVWWVFVMSKVTLSSVTVPAGRAVLKEKEGEVVVLVLLSYLMYFCLHNYMNNSRNKISTFRIRQFRIRQFHSAISGFSDGCWGVTGDP